MALTHKRLAGPLTATTSTTSIYTVPQNCTTIVKEFVFTNRSNATATVTIYLKDAGVTLGDGHIMLSELSLAADETFSMATSTVLHNNGGTANATNSDQLHIVASAADAINVVINGIEDV